MVLMARRNNRKFLTVLFCVVCMLTACGPQSLQEKESEGDEPVQSDLEASAIIALDGKDNTMDAYMYTLRKELEFEKDGTMVYGLECALGESIVWMNAQHSGEEYWQEFISMDQDGTIEAAKRTDSDEKLKMGTIVGTNRYILYDCKWDETNPDLKRVDYEFQIMNEQGECTQIVPVPHVSQTFTAEEELFLQSVLSPIMDEEGIIYFIYSDIKQHWETGEEQDTYLDMLSATGELVRINLGKDTMNYKLLPSYDGSILLFMGEVIHNEKGLGLSMQLKQVDRENGEVKLLMSVKDEFPGDIYCATMLDEMNMVYVNNTGLYKMDLQTEETKELYQWIRHGLSVAGVETMRAYEDGRIEMVYWDGNHEFHYVSLRPVTEKIPVQAITLAATESGAYKYHQLVADFNKLHPNCIVEIKTDYDETALLTQLIAGDGPVLIDTMLTGFSENKKLWEPLDGVLTDLGIYEYLQPKAMELGKIDGTLYGMIDSFFIDTVRAGETDLTNWDYDEFIRCMEDGQNGTTIVNRLGMEKDGTCFLTNFFVHGLEDCYLFDAKTGEMIFEKKEFKELLRLTKQYVVNQDYEDVSDKLLDGTVLGNCLTITKPKDLAMYRIIYGDDINYIGYPGKAGSNHYLASSPPLAIRHTADKADKELAVAFLMHMLSYESQMSMRKDLNFHLSVRKDVLEVQIDEVTEETILESVYFGRMILKERINKEKDRETLYALIENAKPEPEQPYMLLEILHSEMEPYFEGKITEDDLIKNLTSRVGLYLEERQ